MCKFASVVVNQCTVGIKTIGSKCANSEIAIWKVHHTCIEKNNSLLSNSFCFLSYSPVLLRQQSLCEKCHHLTLFGLILLPISPHSDWIERYSVSLCIQYECGKIRTRTRTLFTQYIFHIFVYNFIEICRAFNAIFKQNEHFRKV